MDSTVNTKLKTKDQEHKPCNIVFNVLQDHDPDTLKEGMCKKEDSTETDYFITLSSLLTTIEWILI